jgi:extracellular solute-binding protein/von Willebrand factor type A domain-containing protein
MEQRPEAAAPRRRSTSPVVLLSALLVLALVGWLGFDYVRDRLAGNGCTAPAQVQITAATDIAPVLAEIARTMPEQTGAGCYRVSVTSADSARTSGSLVTGGADAPDVWVPESSMWLLRARDAGAWNIPESGQPVASSPIVLALTEDAAGRFGWPGKTPNWPEVLGADPASTPIGLPDPSRDPVGVSALLGIKELTASAADPPAAFTAAIRRLTSGVVAGQSELFPRQEGKAPFAAFPASEHAVLTHNLGDGGSKLVAAYAGVPMPSLDYPYVVLPKASEASRSGAEKFLRELLQPAAVKVFADAGFRTTAGQVLGPRTEDGRTSVTAVPVQPPASLAVDAVLQVWAGVNLSARVQVLLDVSGSMAAVVPGTAQSRMQLTVQAAIQGIGLFKPTTELGLWLFSTKLDGDKDYRELLPMRSISDQVAAGGLGQLQGVKPKPGGATGLYDSVLAAYQSARQSWEPGRINIVVALTDGRNEDQNSISKDQLIAELGKLQDPRKPLPVVGIGIGPDIDASELQSISAATGGQAFTTADPTKISEVFYQALSKIVCQPPSCKR